MHRRNLLALISAAEEDKMPPLASVDSVPYPSLQIFLCGLLIFVFLAAPNLLAELMLKKKQVALSQKEPRHHFSSLTSDTLLSWFCLL